MMMTVGAISGRRNKSTRRKPAPVPLCPPQIPHDLTSARTRLVRPQVELSRSLRKDTPRAGIRAAQVLGSNLGLVTGYTETFR
jgi:hypothetical protein